MPYTPPAPVLFDSVEALDAEHRVQLKAATSHYTNVACRRCSGDGYGYFLTHTHKVVCFGCGGTGKVIAPKQRAAFHRSVQIVDIWRMRCLYLLMVQELRAAEAEALARPHWSTKQAVKTVENRLACLVRDGKELAARL